LHWLATVLLRLLLLQRLATVLLRLCLRLLLLVGSAGL
jgi:hypothetical protein